ncbi:MAG TPA: chromosome segregation protein SMC [Microbacteriaceae bacterium]|nr:chromosome segregation protein SMC [Microbacteriaceae bacterium]HQX35697.1 chromosome segregation protein SMC [Microbacteriaceae bacterium]HQZ48188.1 chromosome segregation protein SMC [Microbacteriaceae bacterium]
MHLKSLTLKGFKSFAQPTTFAFETGVTCIVGPNGSGKSNVVDALAWVMGEQGAKTLRGGKMEDVIFAGTATRGPLGRAEVQLTIDNSDGALPIEYAEVTISRTLFRNGSSEYAINGDTCRLLDVQELLSDSGLGREMHVIVGQGRLDGVLHASPEDRRGFIEEAAGILKHRRRKEKTLRKLDAMQANLTRLSDLAGEIRRQLKPLGHQAEIAREAQTIAAIARDAKARLYADDVVSLRAALADHTRGEQERHAERLVLQEQLEQVRVRVARIEQTQTSDAVDEARRVAFELEQVQERLRGLFTLAVQRLALLGSEDESVGAHATVLQAHIDEAKAEVAALAAGLGVAADAVTAASHALARARTSLDALDADIAAQSVLISAHDVQLTKLKGAAEAAASTLAAVRGGVLRQQNALDAALLRRDEAAAALAGLDPDLVPDGDTAVALGEAFERAQRAVTVGETDVDALRERLHTAERERDALTAQVGALSRAMEVKNGASALLARDIAGLRGLVGDHVHVQPGFEAAIATVLGSLAEGVLVDDRDAAYRALDTAGDVGRIEFVIADGGGIAPARPVWPAGLAGVVPAVSVVTAPAGVLGVLSFVGVADDLEAARVAGPALTAAELGGPITLVTRTGDIITDHTLQGGSGGQQSRLELLAERDAAAVRLEAVREDIDGARAELQDRQNELDVARYDAKESLRELREHDAALAAQAETVNRVKVRHESAVAECERLATGLTAASAGVSEAEAKASKTKRELEAAQQAPRPMMDATARAGLLADVEAAREAEVRARLDVETLRERVRASEAGVVALQRQRESERAAAEAAARRAVIRRRQQAAAEGVVAELPLVLASVDGSLTDARVALAGAEAERAERNSELVGLRAQETELRERLAVLTENVHGLELQIYEKKLHVSSLLERVASELGLEERILVSEYGPDQPVMFAPGEEAPANAPATQGASDAAALDGRIPNVEAPDDAPSMPFDRAAQQKRLVTAERKLAQLGRVNPLALEEFAALEQRHAFLTDQLGDLVATRKDLMTIIDELDDRMQTIFAAAFEDTKAAFGEVFPTLFPGGTGSITLTDPDNLLTTGIEVAVRPAGKKIERLSLLSGGERSLAAVALLVAIFKARPSPFYILDEVEAALDDANLGRLLTVFEDLRETSQLIVITHQKRTMEIADALYGVSMRQDGVSAVVGQRVGSERAGRGERAERAERADRVADAERAG